MKRFIWIIAVVCALFLNNISTSTAANSNLQPTDLVVDNIQEFGTTDWQIEGLTSGQNWDDGGNQPSDLLGPRVWTDSRTIKGYASEASINHGESIDFHVSTSQATYNIDVYRMGWYGGAGGRWVAGVQNLTGQDHGIPLPDPTTGMIEAT